MLSGGGKRLEFRLVEGVNDLVASRLAAFTLAEILITLGIIGIVAALTLPTLIGSYKKKVFETRFEKLYSTLSQAAVMSQVKNGDCRTWDFGSYTEHRNTETMKAWWKQYFEPYLIQVIQAEKSSGTGYRVYFNDGSSLRIEALPGYYARIILYPSARKINYGLITREDKAGKDYFMFTYSAYSCKFEPIFSGNSNADLIEQCLYSYNHFYSNNASGGACAELIIRNGWKVPDDYPIKL